MGNSGSSSVAAAAGGYEVNPKSRLGDASRDNETTSEAEQHSSHLEGMEAYSEGEAHDKDALTVGLRVRPPLTTHHPPSTTRPPPTTY